MPPDLAIDELRTRLFDLEAQVEEMREQLAAAGHGGGVPTPPPRPLPAWDEPEPDSRMLDGTSGRREDKSLEWAAGAKSVLRLYDWSNHADEVEWDVATDDPEEEDDGLRFLARVPVDPSDKSKGSVLRYVRILKLVVLVCNGSATPAGTSGGSGS